VLQGATLQPHEEGTRHPFLGERPADVQELAVLDPGRTRTFTGAAGETAVEVQLSLLADRLALEQLLHLIDAPARTVELISQQLISRAGRQAESTVHAAAQDGVCLPALSSSLDEIGERGLHNLPIP
jgi:hypothetical protein